uniref:Uncharacterized protein n=1 Tax=Rhizophora mucronata TaxID=61149 RepID=A0A2P2QI68_RHIMU
MDFNVNFIRTLDF